MKILLSILAFVSLLFIINAKAQKPVEYPYPVKLQKVHVGNKTYNMAYMYVQSYASHKNKTVLLLHGKNFNGYYWRKIIPVLVDEGYNVVVPDQLGFGKSDKPIMEYSFDTLAKTTIELIDSLHINKCIILGHSMGGMLTTKIATLYHEKTEAVIYENPIGLEDYSKIVPATPLETLIKNEQKATYTSILNYQKTYYTKWDADYEQYAKVQAAPLKQKSFKNTTAKVNALTYKMIYEQPVVTEFHNIKVPTLIIIGQDDRTVVGKNLLSAEDKKKYGNYPKLGKWLHKEIKKSELVEIPETGHIPHIEATTTFNISVLEFLGKLK